MSPREAFKFGFLARCVLSGHSPQKTAELVKRAGELQEKSAGGLSNLATTAGVLGAGALLSLPPALGALGAIGVDTVTRPKISDHLESIKKRELALTYRRYAHQLREQAKLNEKKKNKTNDKQVYL